MTDTKLDHATLTSEERARLTDFLSRVEQEVIRASRKFGKMHSTHEAYAVLLEEVDELWDEIKANNGASAAAFNEAVQVSAMGARYALDLFAPASELKIMPCGCVQCTCENEIQCQGCGAKVCETHRQPAKVECPNCGEMVEHSHSRYAGPGPDKWTCQPAQPKPAAPGEISELDDRHMRMASPEAQAKFRADMDRRAIEIGMERLVGVANHPISEAVTVGTWQLEELLKYADLAEVALRTGFHPPEFLFTPADRSLRQCIDAIKEQLDRSRAGRV